MDDHRLDVFEFLWIIMLSAIMYLIIGAIK